ncbi:MAG TPA: hypothetical protein VNZ86_15745 [Bacteroidia bacterium]|jgi:hypothetical protein|nr:hypothetical protein [Bacteroidia bacterium]
MFNSQFIEVGIGIVFIFLLMSIFVSGINELIASILSNRGKQLKEAITLALNDPINKDWAEKLYNHPLIDTLRKSEKSLPAYISSDNFAKALIDLMIQEADTDSAINTNIKRTLNPVQDFINGLNTMRASDTRTLLASFVSSSEGNYEKLKANIENWYTEYMNRVTGWYKKKTKKILFLIGIGAAVLMNVDTVHISQQLWENTLLRTSLVNEAVKYADEADSIRVHNAVMIPLKDSSKGHLARLQTDSNTFSREVQNIRTGYDHIQMLHLPIGWVLTEKEHTRLNAEQHSSRIGYYYGIFCIFIKQIGLSKIIGWIFTAIAISFGAPIWFDLLNKLINLRNTGTRQDGKH